jgi:hypothetical protein
MNQKTMESYTKSQGGERMRDQSQLTEKILKEIIPIIEQKIKETPPSLINSLEWKLILGYEIDNTIHHFLYDKGVIMWDYEYLGT